jgi:hypothetical protein
MKQFKLIYLVIVGVFLMAFFACDQAVNTTGDNPTDPQANAVKVNISKATEYAGSSGSLSYFADYEPIIIIPKDGCPAGQHKELVEVTVNDSVSNKDLQAQASSAESDDGSFVRYIEVCVNDDIYQKDREACLADNGIFTFRCELSMGADQQSIDGSCVPVCIKNGEGPGNFCPNGKIVPVTTCSTKPNTGYASKIAALSSTADDNTDNTAVINKDCVTIDTCVIPDKPTDEERKADCIAKGGTWIDELALDPVTLGKAIGAYCKYPEKPPVCDADEELVISRHCDLNDVKYEKPIATFTDGSTSGNCIDVQECIKKIIIDPPQEVCPVGQELKVEQVCTPISILNPVSNTDEPMSCTIIKSCVDTYKTSCEKGGNIYFIGERQVPYSCTVMQCDSTQKGESNALKLYNISSDVTDATYGTCRSVASTCYKTEIYEDCFIMIDDPVNPPIIVDPCQTGYTGDVSASASEDGTGGTICQ